MQARWIMLLLFTSLLSCKDDVLCGDGAVGAGETCDDGNTADDDGCSSVCAIESCGDGVVNGGEACDDGNTAAGDGCDDLCALERCGDGVVNNAGAETCDDANQDDTDGCTSDCQLAACGDGFTQAGVEACDDGNQDDNDGCTSLCQIAACGDGFTQAGVEECDDANQDDTDSCTALCLNATCGDGFTQAGVEECDDANQDDTDDCLSSCQLAVCGDGFTQAGVEACDDGNLADNDGCDADCSFTQIAQVVAGGAHTCTLLSSGSVRCFGLGTNGRLGYGNVTNIGDDERPRDAGDVEVGGRVIQLSAGNEFTCALLDTGSVRCWGRNNFGQLGYGNLNDIGDDETPASAGDVNVGGVVTQISAGFNHACALLDSGALRCWGSGANGRLGYGNSNVIGDDETPDTAGDIALGGVATQVSAGNAHTCALLDNGDVLCWGAGALGRLGYANTTTIGDNETPASVGAIVLGRAAVQVEAGNQHTCARLDNNTVRCWGNGANGRLGYANLNNIGDDETPASAGNVTVGGAAELSVFSDHTCIRLANNNAVRCWGNGANGRLGYANLNDIGDDETPASAGNVSLGAAATQIAAGATHSCALLNNGVLRCWGNGANGRLGNLSAVAVGDDELPSAAGLVNLGGAATQLSSGGDHNCALLSNGSVRCWGFNGTGQLGYGNTANIGDNESPAAAGDVSVGATALEVSANVTHSCALLTGGAVRCWGLGASGRLGYGNLTSIGDNELPSAVGPVNVGGTVVQIVTGAEHTCALLNNGNVRCWGSGASGRLGYGDVNDIGDDETPNTAGNVNVGGAVVQLTAGSEHTCALLNTGSVRCWGNGSLGRLGYGDINNVGDDETPSTAGDIALGGAAIQLEAGDLHTCALLDTGSVRCWGFAGDGELGYGNTQNIGDNETPASAGDLPLGASVIQVTAGGSHTCALLVNDEVRCWGFGANGRLGYGNEISLGDNEAPFGDVSLLGVATQLVAGGAHTCALLQTGAVQCFGGNGTGQLGYANRINVGDDELPSEIAQVLVF